MEYVKKQNGLPFAFLDTHPDPVFIIDTDGLVVYANEKACSLSNKRMENVLTVHFTEVFSDSAMADRILLRGLREKSFEEHSTSVDASNKVIRNTFFVRQIQNGENVLDSIGITVKQDICVVPNYDDALTRAKVIESSSIAFAMSDLDGRLTYANIAFMNFFASTPDNEITGRYFWQLDNVEIQSENRDILSTIREKGSWKGIFYIKRNKDNELFLQVSANTVTGASGVPDCILVSFVDISEHKRIELDLYQSKIRYQALIEANPDLMFRIDNNCIFQDYQAKDDDNLYVPPELFKGKSLFDVMPPKFAELVSVHIRNALDTWSMQIFEYQLPVKNKVQDFEARIVVCGENEVLVLIRNITDKMKMIRQLKESEEKYRSVVENITIGISVIGKDMRILSLNRQMKKWFPDINPEKQPICYQAFNSPPRDEVCSYCPTINTLRDGDRHVAITDTPTAEGVRNYRVISTPIRDSDGNVISAIEMVEDITEQQELHRQLEQRAVELEASNRELKETTTQLVQSEKLSALGELAAGVAHELKQPLNGIKIICQSQLRDIKNEIFSIDEIQNDLTDVVSNIDRMSEIIDHMRMFTRNTLDMPNELTDINEIVKGPFKLLSQALRGHDIQVSFQLHQSLPKINGDPIRLEQVFMNLITNAKNSLEADRQNKARKIEIRSYRTTFSNLANSKAAVVVEVEDNGIGIQDQIRDKIFQPFYTTNAPGKGTGLGLSVSNRIIEQHHGRIEVESKEKEGAVFRVILPAPE